MGEENPGPPGGGVSYDISMFPPMPLTCCFMEKRILDSFDKCFTNKMLASEDQLRGSGVVGKKRQSRLESNDIS